MRAPWERASPTSADFALHQLLIEIPTGHVLEKRDLKVVARNGLDDIVVIDQNDGAAFFVHLTYSRTRETDPRWPNTEPVSPEQLKAILPGQTGSD
ncbi:MAG: hypothetical protein AAFV38_10410 [Pseudomonadota bacterium]